MQNRWRRDLALILGLASSIALIGGVGIGFLLADSRGPSRAPAFSVPGRSATVPDLANLEPRNGIDPKAADRYWEKWHLVTTRYRRDNNQTRLIYANDIAWSAMLERASHYPDGAMLAKAIFWSEPDPVFPSSVVPKIYKEVELMKKDQEAFSNTGGWGFSMYEYSEGASTPAREDKEHSNVTMQSCYSCHHIVENRDFVFAVPAFLQWYRFDPSVESSLFEEKFTLVKAEDLEPFAKKVVKRYKASSFETFKFFTLPSFILGQKLAIDSVAQFTVRDGYPHLVIGQSPQTFLLTVPNAKCVRFAMTGHRTPSFVYSGTDCDHQILFDKPGPSPD